MTNHKHSTSIESTTESAAADPAAANALTWPTLPPTETNTADILIVGLGPGRAGDIPLAVWQVLHSVEQVILRTERHPSVAALADTLTWTSCDDLYAGQTQFQSVYAQITQRVLQAARTAPVVYAVPGHPWIGEATTELILEAAAAQGMTARVLGGASFIEPSFGTVGIDGMEGSQVADGMLLAQRHHPQTDVGLPLLIGQIYARRLASEVKLTLLNAYPPQHPVTLIQAAGTSAQRSRTVPLHELDRRDDFDHLTTLYVPPLPHGSSLIDLQELIAHLRAPEGCPWDQEQTLESLRPALLDEACEVLEAIDAGDDAHTAEELGDLLSNVVMMAQIAGEEGRFQMADVSRQIVHKLIRRHPHVFGDEEVANMEELFDIWNAVKAQERVDQGKAPKGALDGIPAALPALEKARKLQSKAEKAGLLDRAELATQNPALAALLPADADEAALGQLLWQLVALAKERGLNAENALRQYVVQFRESQASSS